MEVNLFAGNKTDTEIIGQYIIPFRVTNFGQQIITAKALPVISFKLCIYMGSFAYFILGLH